MGTLKNRIDMIGYITVKNSNPNGDVEMNNMPRQDVDGYGLMSDVCLKRVIRDNVALLYGDKEGYDIYISNDGVALESKMIECLDAVKEKDLKGSEYGKLTKEKLCKKYFDIRTFGAVITGLSKIPGSDAQIMGPACVTFAESLEPIAPQMITISRVSVQTEKDNDQKASEFGRKWIVPYAVYRFEVHLSVAAAEKTGFSEADLSVLIESIRTMYENRHSASKSDLSLAKLFVFRHDSKLGNCPMSKLSSLVKIEKVTPALGKAYYDISIDQENIPQGVSLL